VMNLSSVANVSVENIIAQILIFFEFMRTFADVKARKVIFH
jgi:hypothetical protein